MAPKINVLMVGTGEYTTGFVDGRASGSDKKVGVVGLTLFDLRRRGKVGELSMAGTTGSKFPAIRAHLERNIRDAYNGLDVSFAQFPPDASSTERDPEAYVRAMDEALRPGDAVVVFTPDPTHFPIALHAVRRGLHVMLTKPACQLLAQHAELLAEARAAGVFVYVEHHKRFDPAYADARQRARALGDFNYFYSYMSQPRSQLDTFRAWAGRDSDISYYLNSHHVDVCESMLPPDYRPVSVAANGSRGVAETLGRCVAGTEDTISLLVRWQRRSDATKVGTAVYTASWTAPLRAGLHSNQYFHYLAAGGEIRVDQAKRGYDVADDDAQGQLMWYNPFYMQYAPDEEGNFAGQGGYGYVSFEKFVDACNALRDGRVSLDELDARALPTLKNTIATTAILEAGRRSLDEGRIVYIDEKDGEWSLR